MKLFGTADICGSTAERVMPEFTLRVGHAAGRAAFESDAPTEFVVDCGGRMIGQGLVAAAKAGLFSAGAGVTRVGAVLTSALAFASRGRHGVMLTAFHDPPTDSGIKMFADGQRYDRDLEHDVEARIGADAPSTDWDDWGVTGTSGVFDAYRDAVIEFAG